MSGRAIFAQIQVKSILFFLHSQLPHPGQKLVVIVFPLAAADNLTDSRHQTVYCSHSLSVIILFHIE